jgi:hypothetical protein
MPLNCCSANRGHSGPRSLPIITGSWKITKPTESLSKLVRARSSLRNFVVKWLQHEDNKSRTRDYALAAFYSKEDNGADWRFSFIKIEQERRCQANESKIFCQCRGEVSSPKNKIPGNFHFIQILRQAPVFLKIMVILLFYKSWFRHFFIDSFYFCLSP